MITLPSMNIPLPGRDIRNVWRAKSSCNCFLILILFRFSRPGLDILHFRWSSANHPRLDSETLLPTGREITLWSAVHHFGNDESALYWIPLKSRQNSNLVRGRSKPLKVNWIVSDGKKNQYLDELSQFWPEAKWAAFKSSIRDSISDDKRQCTL